MTESYRSGVNMTPVSNKRDSAIDTSPCTVLSPGSIASSMHEDDRMGDRAFGNGETPRSPTMMLSMAKQVPSESKSYVELNHARLIRPMAPSAESDGLQRRVSELRVALQTAEQVLDRTQSRLELAEGARRAAESESATLRARVWSLEGSEVLAGGVLHDGSIDSLRGRLLQEATAELAYASKVTTAADHKVQALSQDCKKLQDTIAALSAASAAENETLAIELEQARMRIRSDAREVAALTERAAQAEVNSLKWRESNEIANSAISRYQVAEKDALEAKEKLADTMRHNEFLQGRVNELQAMSRSNPTSHYGQELRHVREQLGAEISRLNSALKQERASRQSLESQFSVAMRIDAPEAARGSPSAGSHEALELEKSKNVELLQEIDQLKAQIAHRKQSPNKEDDWSNALGLESEDEDEQHHVSSPRSTPTPMRDALLEAARLEVLKLGEMNRKLMQAKMKAEKDCVSKQEFEAALARNNEAWATKVAAVELEATKIKEQLSLLESQKLSLEKECEVARLELDDVRTQMTNSKVNGDAAQALAALEEERKAKEQIARRVAEAVEEAKAAKAQLEHLQTTMATSPGVDQQKGSSSWLTLLPRRHSSPGILNEKDNSLACLGSWASLNALDEDDEDMCRLEDEEVNVDAQTLEREKYLSRVTIEERSKEIHERLGARRTKPPLSPLKASQEAMERSIREGRLAMEAMRASRTSLVRTSMSSLKKTLSDAAATKRNI
jgi:hypothetical protein